MKVLQLFDTPLVQCPRLAFTQQSGQDYSSVDFPLRREANAMVIENLCAQPPWRLACFADPGRDFFIQESVD